MSAKATQEAPPQEAGGTVNLTATELENIISKAVSSAVTGVFQNQRAVQKEAETIAGERLDVVRKRVEAATQGRIARIHEGVISFRRTADIRYEIEIGERRVNAPTRALVTYTKRSDGVERVDSVSQMQVHPAALRQFMAALHPAAASWPDDHVMAVHAAATGSVDEDAGSQLRKMGVPAAISERPMTLLATIYQNVTRIHLTTLVGKRLDSITGLVDWVGPAEEMAPAT